MPESLRSTLYAYQDIEQKLFNKQQEEFEMKRRVQADLEYLPVILFVSVLSSDYLCRTDAIT